MSLIPYYVLLNLGISGVIQVRLSKSAPVFQKTYCLKLNVFYRLIAKNAIGEVEAWEV